MGLPGLALLLALLGTVFVTGARGLRRADASERAMLAAALAAAAGFVSAAAIDWVWQVTVVPVAFLLLAAAVLRSSGGGEVGGVAGRLGSQRTALAAVSVCALVVIGVPMLAISDVRQSQEDVRAGHLDSAISDADSAAGLMSFAATPNLQRALVFEAQGNLGAGCARGQRCGASRIDQLAHMAHPVPDRLGGRQGEARRRRLPQGALPQPALAPVPAGRSGVMAEHLDPRRDRAEL